MCHPPLCVTLLPADGGGDSKGVRPVQVAACGPLLSTVPVGGLGVDNKGPVTIRASRKSRHASHVRAERGRARQRKWDSVAGSGECEQ